jgi:hypothetical protein
LLLSSPPALAVIIAAPGVARARVQDDFTYAWTQIWQAAIRLVRVDLGCPITDRDEDIGYLMFDYREAGREHHGSVELVRTTGSDGIERVRAVVQIPSLPSYVERMILDRLTRKLREDFGDPPRRVRPPRAPPPSAPPAEEPPGDAEQEAPRQGD